MMFSERAIAYFCILPYLVCYIAFFVMPGLSSLYISFTDWPIIGAPDWVGLANYSRLVADELMWTAFRNTAYYTVVTVVIMYVIGLALANLLNARLRGRVLVRGIIFSSYVVMVSAVGILWRWIYEPNYGLLNHYLEKIGLGPIDWLTDPSIAMLSVIIATVWWTAGYNMVVFLAGLQDIPGELYEAARVDGASRWQMFWYVTMPSLKGVSFFVIIMSIARSFQMFGQVFVMTQGGPSNSTLTLVQYLYVVAFRWYEMGYASAIAYVLFALLAVVTLLQFRVYLRTEN